MDQLLERLARSNAHAASLETLTRPLLDLGQQVTGMESVYLTTIDETAGVQRIIYSRNTGSLQMREGLQVPWQDTLCRRALNEQRFFTNNVPGCWGDSEAARQLGIRSYLTLPSTWATACSGACAVPARAGWISPRTPGPGCGCALS